MGEINLQTVNIVISAAAFITSTLLAGYAWRRRQVQGALWFAGVVAAVAWVTGWYVFEAAGGDDLNAYVTFSKLEYVGLTFIPLLWLGFALTFSGRERPLSRNVLVALSTIPIVTIVLMFTTEWHGLIYAEPRWAEGITPPVFAPVYGAWFWVFNVYSYLIFLVGSVVLVRRAFGIWRLYRAQAALVFVGTALPWISNLLLIFDDINPFPNIYLNALFLGAAMICLAFAVFRLRLLDIMPLAYDTILNNVPQALVVVDMQDRVVALNQYVKAFVDNSGEDPIGKPLKQVFSRYAAEIEALSQAFDSISEMWVGDTRIEIRISPVVDRQGRRRGRLFVISDVTARAMMEKAQIDEQIFAETIREIGTTLNSILDTNQILSVILDNVGQLVAHNHANILMIEPDGVTTRVRQHRGYSPEAAARLEAMEFDYRTYPTFSKAAIATEPVIVPDTAADPEWKVVEGLEDIRSFACAPIRVDGDLVGLINIDGGAPGTMKPQMARRLQVFAQQAGNAIKNARLYEQTRRQAEDLERFVGSLMIAQQVYEDIGYAVNIRHLLNVVLDAALRLSIADGGYIALAQDDTLEIARHYGSYAMNELASILKSRSGIVGDAINEQRSLLTLPPAPVVSALDGTLAQIALPLFAGDEGEKDTLYGIIVLETEHPERFTEDRFQLLGLIAERVAVALQTVRLVDTLNARAAELETLYDRVSRLEQLKSDMIRIAAHDLKNPLSVIINYLDLLTDYPDVTLDVEHVYAGMKRSSRRMNQIIQDFLSLDRIQQVADQQTMHPFDLREVVRKVADEFSSRAAQKSQAFEVCTPDDECMVNADSAQLYEAIANFVSNAIKYTPDAGRITVNLTRDGEIARLEVTDTGYGIPDAQQDDLFQPFFRVDTQETQTIEGTGLGLHLTKNIIERQGGTILFYSVHGEGSTFGFTMPIYHDGENVKTG